MQGRTRERTGVSGIGPASRVSGKRVLVLGGGNVAIDAAMSARRLGAAWVGMACLESREQMPAHDWEVRDAEEEGIEVFASRTFSAITQADGQVTGVDCAQVDFRGFIEGRPDFDILPQTEEHLAADVVIFAIGQRPDIECLKGQVDTLRGRFPVVDAETLATTLPGVFAGGDAVTGTTFVVDAIAAGHKAAGSIDRFLRGEPALGASRQAPPSRSWNRTRQLRRVSAGAQPAAPRTEPSRRPAAERRSDFGEVYAALSEAQAMAEAARCLECGVCSECLQCAYACRAGAIDHQQTEQTLELEVGSVLLAPGLEPMPGSIRPEFGFGRYANVVTSLQFERMLSASGPFGGVVQRPSDGAHPRKVAWIQCVGSRDSSCGQGYCSSVCCMYATKEAVIAARARPEHRTDDLLHRPARLRQGVRRIHRAGGEGAGRPLRPQHGLQRAGGSRHRQLARELCDLRRGRQAGTPRRRVRSGRAVDGAAAGGRRHGSGSPAGRATERVRLRRGAIRSSRAGHRARACSWPARSANPRTSPRPSSRPAALRRAASALLAEARGTRTQERTYPRGAGGGG